MEVLLASLLSTDVNQKLAACERLQQKLKESNAEVGLKVMSTCVSLVKEANLKVVLASLECVGQLVVDRREAFSSLLGVALDALIPRLGDTKVHVRDKAREVAMLILNSYDQPIIVERMTANLSNKNVHIKSTLLELLTAGYPRFAAELSALPGLCGKIVALLNDQQGTVRQSALDALLVLRDAFGASLSSALLEHRVKPAYVQQLESSLTTDRPNVLAATAPAVRSSPVSSPASEGRPTFRRIASEGAVTNASVGFSVTHRSRTMSANLQEAFREELERNALDGGEGGDMDTQPLAGSSSSFHLRSFWEFLHGEKPVQVVRMEDRDLQAMMDRIIADLGKSEDWNKRIQAMVTLQSLAWGSLPSHPDTVQILRRLQDLISTQLGDLRSSICKETCKTLAVLAYAVPQQFLCLLDFWWPKIVRVLAIKIQVMASSADRCIRCIVACCQDNRLLQLILECCGNKNAILRKSGLEYLSLCCALWRVDLLERSLGQIKTVLKVGFSDADAQARKVARMLYWLLAEYSFSKRAMTQLLDELDPSIQKYLQAERRSPDLAQLMALPRKMLQQLESSLAAQSTQPSQSSLPITETAAPAQLTAKSAPATSNAHLDVERLGTAMDDADPFADFAKPRALDGGSSRRLSLTAGPMRISMAGGSGSTLAPGSLAATSIAGTASSSSALGGTSLAPTSSLSKPPSRRLSMANALLPPAVQLNNELIGYSEGVAGDLPPFSSTRMEPPSAPEEDPLLSTGGGSSSNASGATKALAGKENRRLSLSANITGMSALLVNGPKRLPIMGQPTDATATKGLDKSSGELLADYAPRAASKPAENVQVMAMTVADPPPPSSLSATAPPAASASAIEKPFVFCAQSLLKMSEDSSWSVRLKALEEISKRIERAFVNMEPLNPNHMDTFLTVAFKCQDDIQLKVAMEAMKIIKLSLEMFHEQCQSKLNALVLSCFQQLNDRRTSVRDIANDTLTLLRGKFTANIVVRALIHVMMDVPERTKTAVMQYLGVLLPQTDAAEVGMTDALVDLLYKVADVATGMQPKPSITLIAASKRIVVMVYGIHPEAMAGEIFKMKFQQQSTLKTMLKNVAPDIDGLLLQASKAAPKVSKATAPPTSSSSLSSLGTSSSTSVSSGAASRSTTSGKIGSSTQGAAASSSLHASSLGQTLVGQEEMDERWTGEGEAEEREEKEETAKPRSARSAVSLLGSSLDDLVNAKAQEPLHAPNSLTTLSSQAAAESTSSAPRTVSPVVTGRVLSAMKEVDFNYKPSISPSLLSHTREGISTVITSPGEESAPTRTIVHTNPTTRAAVQTAEANGNVMLMRIPGTDKTLQFVLQGLATTATAHHRKEVYSLLKQLAMKGDESYWEAHGHQLLEGILAAAKVVQRSEMANFEEEEEALLSLWLLLLRYRGGAVQAAKLALLSEMFFQMASGRPLQGQRLVLYIEIASRLAGLQPEAVLRACFAAWPDISCTFAPTDLSSIPFRINAQLLLLHAATQSCAGLDVEVLKPQAGALFETLVKPTISSENIELRKASVFLLVEAYLKLEMELLPHIQVLTPAQRQLMMVYVEKKRVSASANQRG